MTKYTLQTVIDGKVIKESILNINKGSKLILKSQIANISQKNILDLHSDIARTLKSNSKIITVPTWLDLQILHQEED